jgi:phosphoesterase RecJ-like protein
MRLMQAGAPLADIIDQVFNRRPFNLLRAWQRTLSTMRMDAERGVIWAVLSRPARHETGWPDTDLQGLANFLLSAEEANLSAVLAEKDDGRVEVSLRARPSFDVSAVALALGGGGHPQAAGCTLEGPLDAVVERVVAALKARISTLRVQSQHEP